MDKNLLMACAVFDKVADEFRSLSFCNSVAEYIRMNLKSFLSTTPLKDLDVYKLGYYNVVTGEFTNDKEKHNWTEYSFPQDKAEALSPVDASAAQKIADFEAKTADLKN